MSSDGFLFKSYIYKQPPGTVTGLTASSQEDNNISKRPTVTAKTGKMFATFMFTSYYLLKY